MKNGKILLLISACLIFAGWNIAGHCQDGDGSDTGMESGIDQSESLIGQNIDSEISGERSQAESEVSQVDTSMDTGGDGR